MRKILAFAMVLMMAGMSFGFARNMYAVAKAGYTTNETTVTFPYEPRAFVVINYETTNVLEIRASGLNTAEVDPAISPTLTFEECGIKTIYLSAKDTAGTETCSAAVIALY